MAWLNLSCPLNRSFWGSLLLNLILLLGGCVSGTDFKGVQREAEALGSELQMEQQRAQELDGQVQQLRARVRELERTASAEICTYP